MIAQLGDRVRRIISEEFPAPAPVSVDALLARVLARHRDYVRAPQAALRKSVVAAMASATADRADASSALLAPPLQMVAGDGGADDAASLNATLYAKSGAAASSSETAAGASAGAAVAPSRAPPKRRREERASGAVSSGGSGETAWSLPPYVAPTKRYTDLGGIGSVLRVLRDVVEYPLALPKVYAHLGVDAPRGVLLHGPPGCGKTLLAHAIAGELKLYFRAVAGPELVGSLSGESEARLRAIFDDCIANAPALLFIDEIDAIAPRRDASARGMERRIVSQLLACMDGLSLEKTGGAPVMLLAATNRPDSLDPSIRRTGRFDREVALPIPDEAARVDILKVLTRDMRLSVDAAAADGSAMDIAGGAGAGEGAAASIALTVAGATPSGFDFWAIARATPGFVGADLAALTREAAACAIDRVFSGHFAGAGSGGGDVASLSRAAADLPPEVLASLCVTFSDFLAAASRVQPSALREGFATVPNTSWDDVGALVAVRAELHMAILAPLRRPDAFAALGLAVPAGVLLFGPPGCGKTLLAKALASESRANFISVKGPELLDKFVGESERAVRALFGRARASAPCIIFFDELDALAPRRGGGGGGGGGESSGVTERVVNQLLTEMDGLETRRDVFVIAATNRPDIIDPAMLRPGRLDKLLFVPLPSATERAAILRTQTRRMPLAPDIDFDALASDALSARFSGADLAALTREAAVAVLRGYFAESDGGCGTPRPPTQADFLAAFERVQPSVSVADERMYASLCNSLRTKKS